MLPVFIDIDKDALIISLNEVRLIRKCPHDQVLGVQLTKREIFKLEYASRKQRDDDFDEIRKRIASETS